MVMAEEPKITPPKNPEPEANSEENLESPVKKPVVYHVHDDLDAPKVKTSNLDNDAGWPETAGATSTNASGPGTNTTIAASFSPTKMSISSADFANGITYDSGNKRFQIVTAGQYIIAAELYYSNPNDVGKSYQTMVYVNGSQAFAAYSVCAASGIAISQSAVKILNLAAGDYIELYGQTGAGSGQSASGALSYLSVGKV